MRGWVIGMILAALLTIFIGVFAAANANIGCQTNGGPRGPGKACLPYVPHGPGGEVVDRQLLLRAPAADRERHHHRARRLAHRQAREPHRRASAGRHRHLVPGLVPWAKAGIIIKQGTQQGSAYAAMMVTGSNGVRMQYNYTQDTAGCRAMSRRRIRAGCG